MFSSQTPLKKHISSISEFLRLRSRSLIYKFATFLDHKIKRKLASDSYIFAEFKIVFHFHLFTIFMDLWIKKRSKEKSKIYCSRLSCSSSQPRFSRVKSLMLSKTPQGDERKDMRVYFKVAIGFSKATSMKVTPGTRSLPLSLNLPIFSILTKIIIVVTLKILYVHS